MGMPYPHELYTEYDAELGGRVADLLRGVRTQEAMVGSYTSQDNLAHLRDSLDWLASKLPVVNILYNCFEDWTVVLYLLKQSARAAFARENYEEGVFHKGDGANGKGWYDAVLASAFGSYMHYPGIALFTQPWPSADRPSPHLVALKGRRFVSVTEADKMAIVSANFKSLRDHSTTLTARNLYKDLISFPPSFMVMISTNVDPTFTSADGGVERSLSVVNWPLKFCKAPEPGTCQRQVDAGLKSPAAVALFAKQLVWLLIQVDTAWMDYNDSRVGPQPVAVRSAISNFLAQDSTDLALEYLTHLCHVVDGPAEASSPADLRKGFTEWMRTPNSRNGRREAGEALGKHAAEIATAVGHRYRMIGTQRGFLARGPAPAGEASSSRG